MEDRIHNLQIKDIWRDDDFNCRASISRESVESLAETINDMGRMLTPVVVQPANEAQDIPEGYQYKLICGFRRTLAVSMLGWETVPAVIQYGLTEHDVYLMNLVENLERKNLNTLEEAIALDRIYPPHRTVKSIAQEIKKPERWVSIRRRLVDLPQIVKSACASGRLTDNDLYVVMTSKDPEDMAIKILEAAKKGRKFKRRIVSRGKYTPTKEEVKELITRLLREGFNPNLIRMLGWTIGQVDDEGLERSLDWIRERRGWLK